MQICPTNKTHDLLGQYTVCPRSIYTSYVVGYYIKWVTILLGHKVPSAINTVAQTVGNSKSSYFKKLFLNMKFIGLNLIYVLGRDR